MNRRGFLAGVLSIPFIGFNKTKGNKRIFDGGFKSVGIPSAGYYRYKLRDVYISPEALEDIRKWHVYELDKDTKRALMRI